MPPAPGSEPKTEELPIEAQRLRRSERRLSDLAAAIRDHERALAGRPQSMRYADIHLYRRLRQISGGRR